MCNNDNDEFSPTFILVEITGRAANPRMKRDRQRERESISRVRNEYEE